MLISKFDLYKSEWLELVFDDRNKTYGAYELRQHYSQTMVKAMLIAFLSVTSIAIIVGFIIRPVVSHSEIVKMTTVPLHNYVLPAVVQPPKPITHTREVVPPATPSATHRFIPLVATPDIKVTVDPPKASTLTTGTIGISDVKGPAADPGTIDIGPAKSGGAGGTGTSDVPVSTIGLERLPEPIGGAAAWSKFLQKNLKYPEMAVDSHMQGRVWVSFIVEKDGHLSDIVVERGVGYGMDQEALRVLKMAPAWRPGIQNGQPVRVKYNIPINFQLGDE